MKYVDKVKAAQAKIPVTLVDFEAPREQGRAPSQASSDFLIHIEQGEWAERIVSDAINEQCNEIVAVKYGKTGKKVAGEPGFAEFYAEYQVELDTIGKRPDILLFNRADFLPEYGYDISDLEHDAIADYVRTAIAGIEVRSSAYLYEKYVEENQGRAEIAKTELMRIKALLESPEFAKFFSAPAKQKYLDIVRLIDPDNIGAATFKVPGWTASPEAITVNSLLKELKLSLTTLQNREYLSITPKVEDLKVVSRWIENFGVPHYYFQVFFDRVFGLPYLDILHIVGDESNEDVIFKVGGDVKNQQKATIKIITEAAKDIAPHVTEPHHQSQRRELGRGRLLFYVSFSNGRAELNVDALFDLLEWNR